MAKSKSVEANGESNQQAMENVQTGLKKLSNDLPPGMVRETFKALSNLFDKAAEFVLSDTQASDRKTAGETKKQTIEALAGDETQKRKNKFVPPRGAVLTEPAKKTYAVLNGAYERLQAVKSNGVEIKLAKEALKACAKVLGNWLNKGFEVGVTRTKEIGPEQKVTTQNKNQQKEQKTTIRRVAKVDGTKDLRNTNTQDKKRKGKAL